MMRHLTFQESPVVLTSPFHDSIACFSLHIDTRKQPRVKQCQCLVRRVMFTVRHEIGNFT